MKTTVFLLTMIFVYNAFACPDLSGKWECRENNTSRAIEVDIRRTGDGKVDLYNYTFTQSNETGQYLAPVVSYPEDSQPGFYYTTTCTKDSLRIDAREPKMPNGEPSDVFIINELKEVSGSNMTQFIWSVKTNIWGNIDAEVVCNQL